MKTIKKITKNKKNPAKNKIKVIVKSKNVKFKHPKKSKKTIKVAKAAKNKNKPKNKKFISVAVKKKKKFVSVIQGADHPDVVKKSIKLEVLPPVPVVKKESVSVTYSDNQKFKQRLEFLSPGEKFEIPTLKNIKRNGIFLFSTPAASLIKIDNFDNYKGIWNNNCREYCANSVEVIVTGKVNLITAPNGTVDVEGSIETDEFGEVIKQKRGRKKMHTAAPPAPELDENGNKVIKTRGRKRIEREFIWPKNIFTIEDAALLNNCEKYTIVNEINRAKKLNLPVPVLVGTKPNSGKRGKPIGQWKFKNK